MTTRLYVDRVENGWLAEKRDHNHTMVSQAVFNSAKQLKTYLMNWVDETRTDHGMRHQDGGEAPTTGEDGPQVQVREPQPGVGS